MVARLSHAGGDGYGYRETVGPWARSLFTLRPGTHLVAAAPVLYRAHAVIGMVPIAFVPYSRLVHMFSAPVQYLVRPYVVYRTRDPRQLGPRPERRGWERLGGRESGEGGAAPLGKGRGIRGRPSVRPARPSG